MNQGFGGFLLLLGAVLAQALVVAVGQVMVLGSNVSSVFPSRCKIPIADVGSLCDV